MDDGSYDNTSKIVEKCLKYDKRFRYIYQSNSGVAIARNKGIEVSKGNYICFLDSDDYYENTFLEKMYKPIIRDNKENDVCYCGFNLIRGNKKNKRKTKFKNGDILIDYILGKVNIHTTGWMIKRNLLFENNIFFTEGVSWGEDFEFFCRVLSVTKKVCYVDEYLTNYTFDFASNQLSSFSIDKIDKGFWLTQRLLKNKEVNKNKKIHSALVDYRLSAAITYRLVNAFKYNISEDIIRYYFNKYKKYILRFTLNNGMRSIKLNLFKIKLLYLLKNT